MLEESSAQVEELQKENEALYVVDTQKNIEIEHRSPTPEKKPRHKKS